MNRTLIVKRFRDMVDLVTQLRPFAKHLQSCGYLLDRERRDDFLASLGSLGVMRFAPVGHMMEAPIGAPHDGRMGLPELTRLVPDEICADVLAFVNEALDEVPFYKTRTHPRPVTRLTDLPLLTGEDLKAHPLHKSRDFLRPDASSGYTFSSGGTSGEPKFTFYTHAEFTAVAKLLAVGFASQGLSAGDSVANLFMPGNLWSSFLAVDQALAHIGAHVLPIGGNADPTTVVEYLQIFQPKAVVGLPTQLVAIARQALESNAQISISHLFYAGEHLSLPARQLLQKAFHIQHFGSAGYASVDAGPIGYQCAHGEGGDHHLFEGHVHLEIENGEGIVTSLVKRAMPIIRLRTGDLLDWLPEPCPCGSSDRRFRLFGRSGSQFNIWGCRLFLEDIEKALSDLNLVGAIFQVQLTHNAQAEEQIRLALEAPISPEMRQHFLDRFYHHSADLRHTHERAEIETWIELTSVNAGAIKRQPRTGKIKVIEDLRIS